MGAKLTADRKRVVVEQRLAFVATVCPDGTPNLSPKGTISVWDDVHLVFADIRSPGTITNFRKNPAVEINVVDPFARKGYRFKGTGQVIVDGELVSANHELLPRPMGGRSEEQVGSPNTRFRAGKSRECVAAHLPAYDDTSVDEQSIRRHWISYFAALNEG
jgi:hypothetical protein